VKKENERLEIKRRFPKLGSFAKRIYDLNIKDGEFWDLFGKMIEKNLYVLDFNEVCDCMEVMPFYKSIQQQKKNYLDSSFTPNKYLLSSKTSDNDQLDNAYDLNFYLSDPSLFGIFCFYKIFGSVLIIARNGSSKVGFKFVRK
jgi:hypothetical protein